MLTLKQKKLAAFCAEQGLLQEALVQSPCLREMALGVVVGGVCCGGAWRAGLGVVGCCWSAVVCSPADAANQNCISHLSVMLLKDGFAEPSSGAKEDPGTQLYSSDTYIARQSV